MEYSDQDQEFLKGMEDELNNISDNDQTLKAISSLALVIAKLYKSLVEEELDEDIALAITQTYTEAIIGRMKLA